jgi:hypothetical protein
MQHSELLDIVKSDIKLLEDPRKYLSSIVIFCYYLGKHLSLKKLRLSSVIKIYYYYYYYYYYSDGQHCRFHFQQSPPFPQGNCSASILSTNYEIVYPKNSFYAG